MGETSVSVPLGPYPGTISATDLDITYVAGETSAGTFVSTGRELVLLQNDTGGALTVTFTSQADPQNRTSHITTYSVGAGLRSAFWFGNQTGWMDGTGNINYVVSAVGLEICIIRIPA